MTEQKFLRAKDAVFQMLDLYLFNTSNTKETQVTRVR